MNGKGGEYFNIRNWLSDLCHHVASVVSPCCRFYYFSYYNLNMLYINLITEINLDKIINFLLQFFISYFGFCYLDYSVPKRMI